MEGAASFICTVGVMLSLTLNLFSFIHFRLHLIFRYFRLLLFLLDILNLIFFVIDDSGDKILPLF